MKFTIQKNEITDVLSRIQGIVGRKTSLAITENVLIKTAEHEANHRDGLSFSVLFSAKIWKNALPGRVSMKIWAIIIELNETY